MNTLQADDNYLKHYDLSHDPFAARVPNFKFFPAQRKTILGQLHHLARHSALMLVVTGPENSGKTLLRQALIASVNKDSVKIANIPVSDCATSTGFFVSLAKELQASSEDLSDIVEQLNKLKEQGVDFYLMIDDASQLSDSVLQVLLNLAAEQLAGLHFFLFARPELLDRIEKSAQAKEVIFNLPLTPYTLDETADYISTRLEGAGQKLALFTEAEIKTIHAESGGWPGAINQIAKDILLSHLEQNTQQNTQPKMEPQVSNTSFSADFNDERIAEPTLFALDDEDEEYKESQREKPKLKLPKKHLMIVAIVAIILILILLFFGSSKTEKNAENTNNGQSVDLSNNSSTQTVNIPLVPDGQAPVNTTNANPPSNQPQPDMPVQPNTQPNTDSTGKPITPPPSTTPVAVSQPTATETVTPPPVEPVVEPKKVEPQAKPVVTPKKEPVKTNPTVKTTGSGGNAWYRNQNSKNFAIQVSVASSESSAKDFLKRHAGSYQYFKRSRAGKVDYVITSGNYSSRAAAQSAIKALPAAVQSSKPWIRSFASIKQELAK